MDLGCLGSGFRASGSLTVSVKYCARLGEFLNISRAAILGFHLKAAVPNPSFKATHPESHPAPLEVCGALRVNAWQMNNYEVFEAKVSQAPACPIICPVVEA